MPFETEIPGDLLVLTQWRPADTLARVIEPAPVRAVKAQGLARLGSYELDGIEEEDAMVVLAAVRTG